MNTRSKVKYIVIGLVIALTFNALILPTFASNGTKQLSALYRDIKLVVDGIAVTPKDAKGNTVEPFIIDGTTYLPVRAVGEALGKTVEWEGATSTVYIGKRPGVEQYMFDVVPAYQSERYTEYSSAKSGGTDFFVMAGQKYTDGCTWRGRYQNFYDTPPSSLYNLNGSYQIVSGILAHVDGSDTTEAVLNIYLDGILKHELPLTGDMIPQNITINVTGVLQLKLEIIGLSTWESITNPTSYGFGNVIIE